MIVISQHVAIPNGELEITTIHAQGTGRQHVNKTSTAIHLRFDIQASSLPEYYKEHLLTTSHHLISSDGMIVIKAQEYHSQELNHEATLAQLVAVIKDLTTEQKAQQPTQPTHASKEHRLASKAQKSSMKALHSKVHSSQE